MDNNDSLPFNIINNILIVTLTLIRPLLHQDEKTAPDTNTRQKLTWFFNEKYTKLKHLTNWNKIKNCILIISCTSFYIDSSIILCDHNISQHNPSLDVQKLHDWSWDGFQMACWASVVELWVLSPGRLSWPMTAFPS